VQVVGCPKTIDNDLSSTDTTFGYDTAVSIATEAIDRIRTTAKSHERIIVVEVMGRHAGWITWGAGVASAANVTLIPEVEPDLEAITDLFKKRAERGEKWGIVAVSEGVTFSEDFVTQTEEKDEFGHVRLGGVGEGLAGELKERTGIDTRHVVLGHLQRGGTPTAYDRILSTRYGLRAAEAVKNGEWGQMVALRGDEIVTVSLDEATAETKTVPDDLYRAAATFFGERTPPVRTPAWMVAYAAVLVLLGATYATLIFTGPRVALVFALAALAAVLTAVMLVLKR
jgi:6-phosphofructokinase 1